MRLVLGIDTSCDDTAVALVNSNRCILAQEIVSQNTSHSVHGGIVPELASSQHLVCIANIYERVMKKASLNITQVDAIAVTTGPGLIGSLTVGLMFAKGLSQASNIPLISVNHLEAHLLSIRLNNDVPFPFLSALISGGHCQIVLTQNAQKHIVVSQTLDDSIGETLDKVARELGLGYPGGPSIERYAKKGNVNAYSFPKPMCNTSNTNLSFSGLKTAVKLVISKLSNHTLDDEKISDICASLQRCIAEILLFKIKQAIKSVLIKFQIEINAIALVGGVASNKYMAEYLKSALRNNNIEIHTLPPSLCTDNAAMIAWNALENADMYKKENKNNIWLEPKARWQPGDNSNPLKAQ